MEISTNGVKRDNPENIRERTHKFVIEHKSISTIGFLLISWVIIRFIPFSWLDIIPFVSGKMVLMLFIANLIGFLPSRWLYKRIRSFPVDFILEAQAKKDENGTKIKATVFQYYEGKFMEDFKFAGTPIKWTNESGKTVYLVRNIDKADKTVQCSEFGEMTDLEQVQAVEKIEQNRYRKHKEALAGVKFISRAKTFADKLEASYVKDLEIQEIKNSLFNPESLMDELEDEIPEVVPDRDEDDEKTAEDVLEELGDVSPDLDASINLETSSDESKNNE